MIHSVLMFNNQGTPRLMKHYTPIPLVQQKELFDQIYNRIKLGEEQGQKTNFLTNKTDDEAKYQIIYKKYSGLYFVLLVDIEESPLRMLDFIHGFVECLNVCFEDVTELDLVFGWQTLQSVLEEMIVGGIVVEIDRNKIVQNIDQLNGGHKGESSLEEGVKRLGDSLYSFASGGFGAWSSSK
ncbi:hypothetical protein QEN19_002623 [Hanseniaspora menglaensis]